MRSISPSVLGREPEPIGMHRWRPITSETLQLCREVGEKRRLRAIAEGRERAWRDDKNHYTYGCLGEALVASLAGVPWRTDTDGSDPGDDFAFTDVKARPVRSRDDVLAPALLRRTDSREWQLYYCLTYVVQSFAHARYVGWATGSVLQSAPVVDYGRGPSYQLEPRYLLRGLPPPLSQGGT